MSNGYASSTRAVCSKPHRCRSKILRPQPGSAAARRCAGRSRGASVRARRSTEIDFVLSKPHKGVFVEIVCLLFDGITALDIVGPYEVLQRLPEADVKFVAHERGEIRTDNKFLALHADYALDEITSADVLVIPGGFATRELEHDSKLLDWIRAVDATTTWTTSVCTGSMLLAAAGLLQGKEATSHWASLERLKEY